MKTAEELLHTKIEAKIKLKNYTFPRHKPRAGDFAIVKMYVTDILQGEIPSDFLSDEALFGDYVITIIGNLPQFEAKEEYIFNGELVMNKKYGPQYQVISVRLNYNINNIEDQKKFLGYFLSAVQIDKLYANYDKPMDLLENSNIFELCKIKGIGPVKAKKMCEKYNLSKNNSRAYVYFSELGLTKNAVDKLCVRYGSPDAAVDRIKENPYLLIREVRGYGWQKADAIALKQGIARNSKYRVLAYAEFILNEEGDKNGNSWINTTNLLTNVFEECSPINENDLKTYIKSAIVPSTEFDSYYKLYLEHPNEAHRIITDERIFYYDTANNRIGLLSTRIIEKEIARHIKRLMEAKNDTQYSEEAIKQIIQKTEEEQGYQYTTEQIEAIHKMLDNNVCILTGSAGVGKTSCAIAVTKILDYDHKTIAQCALSGRASSNLSEMTGSVGKTIHRLLRYDPNTENFVYNEKSPIPAEVVLLDEVSMVGGELFLSLIQSIRTGAKFIMIGDPNQLEALGLCNILEDCISSGYVPIARLTQIHRQAAKSGIIVNANLVCTGKSIVSNYFVGNEIRGELKDFELKCSADTDYVQKLIVSSYKRLVEDQRINPSQIQVLVPMRLKGSISCRELNNVLQSIANPALSMEAITLQYKESGINYSVTFKPGDRIIVTQNNYNALTPEGHKTAIFNGNIGYIKSITQEAMVINLTEQGDVILARDEWYNIQLGYCCTVHKTQGSTIPYVIFGLNQQCYVMLSKELVYTAITRAKKYCIVCSQASVLNKAAHTSKVRLKQTWLKDELTQFRAQELQKKGFQF